MIAVPSLPDTLPLYDDEPWTTSRYEDDVIAVRGQLRRRVFASDPAVFFGSSSFRHWERMAEDLGSLAVANLGFGGGTLESAQRYFDALFEGLTPGRIVLYFGENDIANDGLSAASVHQATTALVERIRVRFGPVPLYHLSIKHSPSRWLFSDEFNACNRLIASDCLPGTHRHFVDVTAALLGEHGRPIGRYYRPDHMHLNAAGYAVWADILTRTEGLLDPRAFA